MGSPPPRSGKCASIGCIDVNSARASPVTTFFVDQHASVLVYMAPNMQPWLDSLRALQEHLAAYTSAAVGYPIEDTKRRSVSHEYVDVVRYLAIKIGRGSASGYVEGH